MVLSPVPHCSNAALWREQRSPGGGRPILRLTGFRPAPIYTLLNTRKQGPTDTRAMPDSSTTVADLRERMQSFVAERDWEQFHSPKNLVMGLSVEVAELMEHFLWMDNDASRRVL